MNRLFARILSRVRRIIFRSSIRCSSDIPTVRLGSDYGGWWVPLDLPVGSFCVSAGVGEDITFDLEIIETFDCSVLAIDPTPKAVTVQRFSKGGHGGVVCSFSRSWFFQAL